MPPIRFVVPRKAWLLLLLLAGTLVIGAIALTPPPGSVAAQVPQPRSPQLVLGNGFTYQGQLLNSGSAVNVNCDFQFGLYDALSGGSQLGITQTVANVSVSRGLFTALVNATNEFGDTAFVGDARWLLIAARCPAGGGAYASLSPRQPLTALPFALPGLRTFPNATSPNIVGGFSGNSILSTTFGSTIAGGGQSGNANTITNSYSFIGGGYGNIAGNIAAVIGGGASNQANGLYATIGGGKINQANRTEATVGGGEGNQANGYNATIGGGLNNQATGNFATVGGGDSNQATGASATVGSGDGNQANGQWATVGGGSSNQANGANATVGGGANNQANGFYATVPGGDHNVAQGNYSFAAGQRAEANHPGAFVWADSTGFPFASTGNDQFLIRAGGGVGIGTAGPLGTLHVATANDTDPSIITVWDRRHVVVGNAGNNGGLGMSYDQNNHVGYIEALSPGAAWRNLVLQSGGGNVGLGVITPTYKLDVNGKVHASGGFNGSCLSAGSFNGSGGSACNLDVAEGFASTELTTPGDLVALVTAANHTPTVRKSTQAYDGLLVGVVSQNPGLVFDNGATHLSGDNSQLITNDKTVVALAGRVAVKVSMENGAIGLGDPLTSSSQPGVAMKATQAGKVIGYALEPADADGQLLLLVQPGYYAPPAQLAAQPQNAALAARVAALEQANPPARSQSNDWNPALAFVFGAVSVLVVERVRSRQPTP